MALPEDSRWFFITGCQRSGTTMLRLILESHSKIFCFDEMQSYRILASRDYEGEIAEPLVGFKIPRFAEQLDQPQPYDYGLTEAPARFYGGQKALFMVRDVRDTVASMLKLRGTKSWLEDWAVPILRHKAARDVKFAQRWQMEFERCERSNSLAAFGALYWAYKNEALLRYVAEGYAVLPISYEALVAAPRAGMGRVCRWLGVDFEEALLDHHQQGHGELYESGLTVGGTDPKRRVDGASVGQWQAWMNPAEERLVSEIAFSIENQIAPLLPPRRRSLRAG